MTREIIVIVLGCVAFGYAALPPVIRIDLNPCTDMDAWWNVVTSVYNFLSASTNLAQTLDNKYSKYPIIAQSPLLIELPVAQRETFLEEFPWFVEMLAGHGQASEEVFLNRVIIPDEEVRNYCEFSPERLTAVLTYAPDLEQSAVVVNTDDMGDGFDIRKAIESVYCFEKACLDSYVEEQEYVFACMVQNQSRGTGIQTSEGKISNEIASGSRIHDSGYHEWLNDSEKTLTSLNYQSYEDVEIKCPSRTKEKQPTCKRKNIATKCGKTAVQQGKQNRCQKTADDSVGNCNVRKDSSSHKCKKTAEPSNISDKQLALESMISEEIEICTDRTNCSSKTKETLTVQEPIKAISSETKPVRQCLLKQNKTKEKIQNRQSETIPKNIDELKEQLHCIRNRGSSISSKLKKSVIPVHTRRLDTPRAEEPATPAKTEEFQVYTANVTQKTSCVVTQKTVSSNRFGAVASVVKKSINGNSTSKSTNESESAKKSKTGTNKKTTHRTLDNEGSIIISGQISSVSISDGKERVVKGSSKTPQLRSRSVDNNSMTRKNIPRVANTPSSIVKKPSSARPGTSSIIKSKPIEENLPCTVSSRPNTVKSGIQRCPASAVKTTRPMTSSTEGGRYEKPSAGSRESRVPRIMTANRKTKQ